MNNLTSPHPEVRSRNAQRHELGGTVLGWFYEAQHAAIEPVISIRPELMKRPDFEINYRTGGVFDKNLADEAITTERRQPLLTAHEVVEQTGMSGLGRLEAVISLPSKQTSIYEDQRDKEIELLCFKRELNGRPHYAILSRLQLNQAYEQGRQTGQTTILDEAIMLQPGESHQIGRAVWLPDVGYGIDALNHDRVLATHYGAVSRLQAEIIIDDRGDLIVDDKDSLYGTGVTVGQFTPAALQAPTGEFAGVG